MEICTAQHSIKDFHFHHNTMTLSAEASELSQGHTRFVFGQVYDDAADEGFVIVSSTTGRRATFVVCNVDYNDDREVVAWHLTPTPETLRDTKLPSHVARMRVTVFND